MPDLVGTIYRCPGCCNCAPSNFNDPNGDRDPVPAVPKSLYDEARSDARKWEKLARRLYGLLGDRGEEALPGDIESSELLRRAPSVEESESSSVNPDSPFGI